MDRNERNSHINHQKYTRRPPNHDHNTYMRPPHYMHDPNYRPPFPNLPQGIDPLKISSTQMNQNFIPFEHNYSGRNYYSRVPFPSNMNLPPSRMYQPQTNFHPNHMPMQRQHNSSQDRAISTTSPPFPIYALSSSKTSRTPTHVEEQNYRRSYPDTSYYQSSPRYRAAPVSQPFDRPSQMDMFQFQDYRSPYRQIYPNIAPRFDNFNYPPCPPSIPVRQPHQFNVTENLPPKYEQASTCDTNVYNPSKSFEYEAEASLKEDIHPEISKSSNQSINSTPELIQAVNLPTTEDQCKVDTSSIVNEINRINDIELERIKESMKLPAGHVLYGDVNYKANRSEYNERSSKLKMKMFLEGFVDYSTECQHICDRFSLIFDNYKPYEDKSISDSLKEKISFMERSLSSSAARVDKFSDKMCHLFKSNSLEEWNS